MPRSPVVFLFLLLGVTGFLSGQRAASPTSRYYRLICLVHLTGTGKAGDPIVPEYVAQGRTVAITAANESEGNVTPPGGSARERSAPQTAQPTGTSPAPTAPVSGGTRPGIVAWSMELTDDKSMAIIHVVAVDRAAFNPILADKRPEIRIFEIGKDSKQVIEAEMRKYRKDFELEDFQAVVQ